MKKALTQLVRAREKLILSEYLPIERFYAIFPALRHHNYKLYFTGNFLSLIGTWMQLVAQAWLVLELTHSVFWVGVVTAVSNLPTMLFSLFAGVVVDRFQTKNILLISETASMVLALLLGALTILSGINLPTLLIIVFLIGAFAALDHPARQSFTFEIVGRESLSSAIALNSATFNGARIVGPALAGIAIGLFGVSSAFLLNAVSFLAVIIALLLIQVRKKEVITHAHPIAAMREGISFAFSHATIRSILWFTLVGAIFSWSFSTVLPSIAKEVFDKGATGLGYMFSAVGVGTVFAIILISAFSKRIHPFVLVFGGNFLFALSMLIFSFLTHFNEALIALFFAGFGLLAQFLTMNATVQHLIPDGMRGRVMSIYLFMFLGMIPLGSFLTGVLAQHLGALNAIRLNAGVVIFYGAFLFTRRNTMKSSPMALSTT